MLRWQIFLVSLFISSRLLAQDVAPVSPACVTPNPDTTLSLDLTVGYAEAIQTYLSAGGDPTQLKSLLEAVGVLPAPDMGDGVYLSDLTGDGINDVIINIAFPAKPPEIKTFVVWIYVCDHSDYRRVYEAEYPQVSTVLDHGMYLDSIQDLNHDSRPEVIYQFIYCGMYCYMDLYIEGWNNATQQMHQMLKTNFQLGDYNFADTDGDTVFDVVVTDQNGGPAGMEPLRRWQTTYGWDGVNFSQRRSVPETPRFGFEAIEDAARALDAGDLQTAAILYQRILNDPTLKLIDERTDAITKSQALFGLLIIRMAQRDQETGAAIYAELQNAPGIPDSSSFPKEFSESLWTQVARTFYPLAKEYKFDEACDAVITELNAVLESERQSPGLDTSYWGNYGMRPRPEDMCPF
jgi:hypothetical protein